MVGIFVLSVRDDFIFFFVLLNDNICRVFAKLLQLFILFPQRLSEFEGFDYYLLFEGFFVSLAAIKIVLVEVSNLTVPFDAVIPGKNLFLRVIWIAQEL